MAIQINYSEKYHIFQKETRYWTESQAFHYYSLEIENAIKDHKNELELPVICNAESLSLKKSLDILYCIENDLEDEIEINLLVTHNEIVHQPSYIVPNPQTSYSFSKPATRPNAMGFLGMVRKEEPSKVDEVQALLESNDDYFVAMPQCSFIYEESQSLEEFVDDLGKSFSEMVLAIIDEHHWKDSDVYKRANITKSVFSSLRSNKDYQPSKNTALALAIGLKLDVDETNDLLEKAGYVLSNSDLTDRIVEYHIRKKNYRIQDINSDLFNYGRKILGVK